MRNAIRLIALTIIAAPKATLTLFVFCSLLCLPGRRDCKTGRDGLERCSQ